MAPVSAHLCLSNRNGHPVAIMCAAPNALVVYDVPAVSAGAYWAPDEINAHLAAPGVYRLPTDANLQGISPRADFSVNLLQNSYY